MNIEFMSFRSKVRVILSAVLQNQHRTLRGFRASSLVIRSSSRIDEREGAGAIKDGRREGEGGGGGYLSRRLDSRSRSWILSPGTPDVPEEEERRRELDETVKPLCVESVSLLSPFPPLPEDLNE